MRPAAAVIGILSGLERWLLRGTLRAPLSSAIGEWLKAGRTLVCFSEDWFPLVHASGRTAIHWRVKLPAAWRHGG